ncbi:hypothetical protein F5146DRAFT_1192425 [Armillaria mellea]|nr:hypothetical protein F5146DRAFT_1192425 [Armillaria mellea]
MSFTHPMVIGHNSITPASNAGTAFYAFGLSSRPFGDLYEQNYQHIFGFSAQRYASQIRVSTHAPSAKVAGVREGNCSIADIQKTVAILFGIFTENEGLRGVKDSTPHPTRPSNWTLHTARDYEPPTSDWWTIDLFVWSNVRTCVGPKTAGMRRATLGSSTSTADTNANVLCLCLHRTNCHINFDSPSYIDLVRVTSESCEQDSFDRGLTARVLLKISPSFSDEEPEELKKQPRVLFLS